MTRVVAIKAIQDFIGWFKEDSLIRKALEMAIQSLSQEPCDDVVSRQAVLNAIEHEDKWLLAAKGHNGLTEMAFSGLKARVDALPSVTQKSGHWIKKEDDTCWWYVCSECEQEPLKNRWNDDDVLSAFCPNCGCRMVEPQESEDKTDAT